MLSSLRHAPRQGFCLLSALALFAASGVYAAPGEDASEQTETLAFRNLQQLVQQEERLLEQSRRPDGSYDLNRVKQGFQDLVNRYEIFLRNNPGYVAGYVAYGLMLDRAGETEIAARMFLRANRLDPNIPVVKNQLGNYLVERENYVRALPYYLAATELEPEEPLYFYQIGNLLANHREAFLEPGIYEPDVLDRELQNAFRKAAELAPEEIGYAYRYAESYYDVNAPDWDAALEAWERLGRQLRTEVERQTVFLQMANIHILKGTPDEADALLDRITVPALQGNRERLRERLDRP